jgi:tetratricopeptide (TPR) repeat protein
MASLENARVDDAAPPSPVTAAAAVEALDERLEGLVPEARRLLREAREAIDKGRFDIAAQQLARAEATAGEHAEFWRLVGIVRQLRQDRDGAVEALRRALELQPSDPIILTNLGVALRDAGQIDAALATLRRACDLGPNIAATWHNLARTLNREAEAGEANEAFARALACDPGHSRARIGYAQTLNNIGRTDESAEEFRRVLKGEPGNVRAWVALANLKTVRLTAEETEWLDRVYAAPGLADGDRVKLGFALAKALEDQQRYDEAFSVYMGANALKRRAMEWNAADFSRLVDATMRVFATPPKPAPSKTLGREVIFVVSLPRSGSTLTEQILASHPDVEGANELIDMQIVLDEESARRGEVFPRWVTQASPADWQRMGKRYLERTERWRNSRSRFTDKSLGTWRHLGAAAAMLPGAHFVIVRRDPIETCLSCFRQLFSEQGHAYSYDMGDMAAYWRDFDRLTRFWNSRYPHRSHDFSYEALLENPESEVRRMLDFLGLPFDPACLAFHRTERQVRTVSAAQVRQPLRSDTARAPLYGGLLTPLRLALGEPVAGDRA